MTNCPLCRKNAEMILDKVKDYLVLNGQSADYQVWLCPSCQIAFSFPFLSENDLAKSYPAEYEAFQRRKSISAVLLKIKYRQDLKLIKKNSRPGAAIFEIGSGRGEFLAEAKKNGFEANGLEISQTGRQLAEQIFGLKLEPGSGNNVIFSKKYDAVILRQVLEHLENPYKILSNIFKNGLKDGGLLFIKIPRLDSWEAAFFKKYWHGYDLPRHRFHFSHQGIINLLNQIGFKQTTVKDEIVYNDVIRSFHNRSLTGKKSLIFKFLTILPEAARIFLAQIVCQLLSFRGAGRMIVLAKKL